MATIDASMPGAEGQVGTRLSRKDVASYARLLWHHGIETSVMLLGSYLQAPHAVQGYFLKCRTEDALALARGFLVDQPPTPNRLVQQDFTLPDLIAAMHVYAGKKEPRSIELLSEFYAYMLSDFTSERHRAEYNSIKHGLRASHGAFTFRAGIEDQPGVAAPEESMRLMGSSKDASFFKVAKPITGLTGEEARINFTCSDDTVSWSLERVLIDLQVLSTVINNTASTLKIVNGAKPEETKFHSNVNDDSWWEHYRGLGHSGVTTLSFSASLDGSMLNALSRDDVMRSFADADGGPVENV